MIVKKFQYFFIVLILIISLASCTHKDDSFLAPTSKLDIIKETGELRVGYVIYAPYVQKDLITGELSGYSVDIVRKISDEMDVKPVFIEGSWQSYVSDLKTEKYDIMIGPLFSTIKRSMEIDFPEPYAYFVTVAGLTKDDENRFQSLEDLNQEGVSVAVPQGWSAHDYALAYLEKANVKAFKQEGASLVLADVLAGNADVALADGPTVQQYLEKNPEQPIKALFLDEPSVIAPAGFGIKKGDFIFLEFLDQSIENLRTSGFLKELSQKYTVYSYDRQYTYVAQ